ncbi:xylulokinase [Pseudonocardia alni]|uniref:xylulokinase n=1 Tax=Pseudonocardia alni TaxID=33907 RepID=UPI0033D2B7E2
MADLVAGVDSSTQSCKVELRRIEDGALLAVGTAPHRPAFPPVSEQDPADWWAALRTALDRARAALPGTADRIRAVSVAAQCHGLVPLDADGRVLRPAKLWNDTTSAPQVERLRHELGEQRWIRAVGSLPTAAFTVGKLARLAEHEPAVLDRLARILLPHDWLTWRLTGRAVTDRSDASGTGYYDAAAGRYLTDVLDVVAGARDWAATLPTVLGPDEPAGPVLPAVADELGLDRDVLVGAGGGDQHASALGLAVRPGDLVYVIGTSGVVFTTAREPVYDPAGIVDGVADMTGGHLPLVSTLNAARVTDRMAALLGVDHAGMEELALRAPAGTVGPVLAAFLDGERKPDRPGATGLLGGLTSATSREELARSAYEGVLLGLYEGAARMAAAGVPTGGRVLATGGGARSAAYTAILADLTGTPVRTLDADEATARGACVQAAAVATAAPVTAVRDAWAPAVRATTEPRPAHRDRVGELVERYRELAGWTGLDRAVTAAETPAPAAVASPVAAEAAR